MAAYAALVSLMHIIDNLHLHPHPSISLRKKQAYRLTQKITFLLEFLEGYNHGYSTEADPLETRIADAAYAAEDVIESHIVHSITNNGKKMTSVPLYKGLKEDRKGEDRKGMVKIEKVIEEMAKIEKEIKEIGGVQVQHQLHTKSTPPDSSRSSSSVAQQFSMVGADEVLLQMKDELKSDSPNLQIIPITGMGGSGKTTLARNIYQDGLILEHFHIRAWVTISQEFSIRNILEQLLKQLLDQEVSHLSEGELGDKLYKHLIGRRYLIVLDDMWSIRAWEGVKMFLPNNINGSRIVVTTRLSNLFPKLPNSSSLKMNLLNEDDSWDLLSKIVFGEKDCPLEFEEIGKEIGKSCKGLPLSIVVVGGLLAKSEHTIEFWKHIEENLNSVVNLEDDERYLKILYMSYKQLPVHLKPCFLYMGVFPEDKEIRSTRLIRLWVAEGFLKPVSKKSMEEIAKECLEDLIGRNLILIHRLGSIGNIKECKIHDLLRDLCLREGEKERFYTVIASQPSPQRIVNAATRRIVVSSRTSKDEVINALSSMPLARSLIWNLENQELPPLNLRLLRIFDSPSSYALVKKPCFESMQQLVNSRYLNIQAFRCPPSIGRFWNLQTLYCRLWQSHATTYILDQLSHIHIRHIQSKYHMLLGNDQLQGDNVLGNLQSLGPLLNFKWSKEIVKRIPNIKKLRVAYSESIYDDSYCLNNIVCLDKLETLSCSFDESVSDYLLRLINFPNSLIKLWLLVHEEQCWEDILDKIGELPLLQKLQLIDGTFREGLWETTEGQFRSLKFLHLWNCKGLQVWKTECSHFPCLETLRLDGLKELEEIPLDFAEISTLRVIQVAGCNYSAVESAKRIVEEQEELYGEEAALQVKVELSEKNEALESLASPNFRIDFNY